MEIIPSIDLREGECARILGADENTQHIRSMDVVEQALILRDLGARWVHITDLDGRFSGHLCNLRIVQEILKKSGLRMQHSGGVRKLEDAETLLSLGVDRVVVGINFLRNREQTKQAIQRFGNRIAPGLDGKNGMVANEGFEMAVETSVISLLKDMEALGVERFVYTDRRRVGAMQGPNFEGISEVLPGTRMKAIVAGGVKSYDDIRRLKEMGVEAVIIGKAIYMGSIELKKAEELARA